ncbi:Nramp family divalent metal transporter [Marinimicrobium locisalis]|uniref:Nramp family divalent metal transporter n=1 Tax=Marinimicrobium locisalis TaxID=546022 RepID=UPI00322170F9
MQLFRPKVPAAPEGRRKWRWYGPGLLWMLSAVGTGSILFTPRVASAYEYQLLWLLLLVVFFMWVMIREMARFSIVTGQTMLEGMYTLKGPRGWAVWLVLVPQLLAAGVGIAGLSAVVGSALQSFLPGGAALYGVLLVVLSTVFVAGGQYMLIERFSRVMALLLMLMVIVSAVVVGPDLRNVATGLAPGWPSEPDLYVILPWVGTILAGSMGIVWFGYWTATRGYGGGLTSRERDDEMPEEARSEQRRAESEGQEASTRERRARAWIGVMTGAASLGVLGGLVVIFSFMVLGSELLAPKDLMPKGADVAVDLSRLFSEVWGSAGEYLLLAAIIIALGGSVLANQDGWGRSFADMTLILTRRNREAGKAGWITGTLTWLGRVTGLPMLERRYLKRLFVVTVTGVVPITIILLFDDPVAVMSASGIIAAVHTPFLALVAIYINRTRLPASLRPGWFTSFSMAVSGLFYLGFAALYFWSLTGS